MRFRMRPRLRFGPFHLNFTEHGYSSWSIKLWRLSWNSRQRQWRVDTPGWGWLELGKSRSRSR